MNIGIERWPLRIVERRSKGGWERVRFTDLRYGDVFRMFEPDGTPVKSAEGTVEFVARSNPYNYGDGCVGITI